MVRNEWIEAARRVRRWKGLDPGAIPVFLGYEQIERMIAALLERAAAWRPDLVVGIARGGLVPATMAATVLALPLAAIAYERATGTVSWPGMPPAGRRVLLVDDGCSTGGTMAAVQAALLREGRACLTLAVVHDPDRAGFVPDLSHPMRTLWCFPWERGETTPAARALRAAGAGPDRQTEAPVTALDLDGLFLADPEAGVAFLPLLRARRAVLITTRPEAERARTQDWLRRHGRIAPLECRPDGMPRDPRSLARFKATAARRRGCTHVVESDPAQAILIAAALPPLIVSWWPGEGGRACIVGAAEAPGRGAPQATR